MSFKCSIVIPTLNERDGIKELARRLWRMFGRTAEIIVSDGGSTDGTQEVVERLRDEIPTLRLLENHDAPELSPSVVHGFDVSEGGMLACIDGDLQHGEGCLLELFEALREADMAIGSRYTEGGGLSGDWPASRKFISSCGRLAVRLLCNVPVSDPMSGCFAIRREAYLSVRDRLRPEGFKTMLELLLRLRASNPSAVIVERGLVFHARRHGASKFSLKAAFALLSTLVRIKLGIV